MFTPITALRSVTLASILIRVALALLLGGLVGMERGLKNHPAGLRTYILVCLGACIVMTTNQYVYQTYGGQGDPVRMGAQVISGIGFLGAGTIIVTARNQVKGLTTAAGLWAAACMGLAIGIGFYELAVVGGIAILVVLTTLHHLDDRMHKNIRFMELYIELAEKVPIGCFIRSASANELEISNLQMEADGAYSQSSIAFIVTLKAKCPCKHDALLKTVRKLEGVSYFEEL